MSNPFNLRQGGNPVNLLHFPDELFISGEAVVKGLTCNDLDLHADNYAVLAPVLEEMPELIPPNLDGNNLVPLQAPVKPPSAPTHTPWLFSGLALMGLNAYFPQLSPVSSLWSPLQAPSQYSTGRHPGVLFHQDGSQT
ncbi:hypothetical protein DSO57_1004097 [Entomophthora muscae]|uniref:Uncharacterized protein n=1 Tax=Entomophthora muscae TaxID=34485 RepID=A0ACC2SX72_9FUNG|nr:hypothetical protein DSO57_1004097 [Entomophthora muscae]